MQKNKNSHNTILCANQTTRIFLTSSTCNKTHMKMISYLYTFKKSILDFCRTLEFHLIFCTPPGTVGAGVKNSTFRSVTKIQVVLTLKMKNTCMHNYVQLKKSQKSWNPMEQELFEVENLANKKQAKCQKKLCSP